MITIEFIHSPDPEIITRYEFMFDHVTLGKKNPANLLINDSDFPSHPIGLKIVADKLHLMSLDTAYLYNGKKVVGEMRLSIGDELTFGQSTFRIISFSSTEQSYEQRLRHRFQEINQSSPDAAVILDLLEEELLHLQVEENQKK